MGVQTQFIDGQSAIFIDDEISDKNYKKLKRFMEKHFGEGSNCFTSWKLQDMDFHPQSGRYGIDAVINGLKIIIKFLNEEKILWYGKSIVFDESSGDSSPGFVVFDEKTNLAAISYIKGLDNLNTNYIPLGESEKLL